MRFLRIIILTSISLFCLPIISWEQISILPGGSTFEMGSALTGNGVTIVGSPAINCGATAYGSFSNGQTTNLGITNGVLLTTGSAAGAAGPNGNAGFSTQLNTTFSDPNLISLETSAVNDVCMFELDVIPQCDSLTIRFIFGSEEYPEYVNSGFNDAFGFFVSGPNPAGGNYNAVNIARLPNNTTVSIDNVNAGSNSQYFVNNTGGDFLQYNGYTVVLSPRIKVEPCQTYHFKLIIGDAGDDSFDSGVLIDFISCTTSIEGSVSTTTSECQQDNGTAAVIIDGGVGPFEYNWSHSSILNGPIASNLPPGDYQVDVTDLGIPCAEPLHLTYSITEFGPVPNFSLFTNDNSPCLGDTIQVWGISDTTFVWDTPNPFATSGDTALFIINAAIDVQATSTNFCGPTTVQLTINPVSSPNIQINTEEIICTGEPLILNASMSGLGFAQWQTPSGANLNGLNVNLGPANTNLEGWYFAFSSFGGCPLKVDSVEITVAPLPTSDLSSATICLGQSVDVNISPVDNYSWNLMEGVVFTDNGAGSSANLSPTINTHYIVSNANGCSVSIQINLLPLPEPIINVSSLQGCAPFFVQFTDNTVEPLSFHWNFGDGGTSINESPGHTFLGGSTDTTYLVTVTVTDNNGCTNTSPFYIQTMLPAVASFTANPISQIFPDASVTVNNTSSGSGNLSAQWLWDNTTENTFTNLSHTFSTWGDYDITLIIQNEWCSDTATQTITILPPAAIADFEISDAGCPGSTFTFISNSIFAASLSWEFGDGSAPVAGDNVSHSYTQTGSYDVTLIAMGYDGIPDTMTLNDAITIHPVPVAAFIIENGYLSAVVDSAVFNNESTGATSFQWNFGNGSTSNLFEPTPHFDLVGTYDVTLTVSNEFGCEDHTSILNGITVVSDGFINFPTAFTPKFQGSSDGSYDRFALDNDIFHPHYRSVLYYDLEIFNKWGELIFKTDNIKVGWDGHYQGNMLGEDTYVYKSKGQLFGGIPFEKSGTVTLLLK